MGVKVYIGPTKRSTKTTKLIHVVKPNISKKPGFVQRLSVPEPHRRPGDVPYVVFAREAGFVPQDNRACSRPVVSMEWGHGGRGPLNNISPGPLGVFFL